MRLFSLLTWVTQLGFSVVCPPLFMLWLAGWIRDRYGIGSWLTLVLGAIGLLISFRSVQSGIRAIMKEAGGALPGRKNTRNKPKASDDSVSFNDHS